jgi:hypothetical protein
MASASNGCAAANEHETSKLMNPVKSRCLDPILSKHKARELQRTSTLWLWEEALGLLSQNPRTNGAFQLPGPDKMAHKMSWTRIRACQANAEKSWDVDPVRINIATLVWVCPVYSTPIK